MKNFKKLLIILVAVTFVLPACKKGANDPMLSLKSRKARITGEWSLKEGNLTSTNGGSTSTYTYSGSTCMQSSGGNTVTFAYTEKMTIVKDGTFKWEINNDGDMTTYEGAWYFGRKNKDLDLKTKETVCFAIAKITQVSGGTTSTFTTTGTATIGSIFVWELEMLKSKQIVVKSDGSETQFSNGTTSISSFSGTMTYKQ